jgi:hypothetical protein
VLSLLSLGAVVENMTLRARSLGLMPRVSWSADSEPSGPVAQVSFSHAPMHADDLAQAIPQRHTNRGYFHGPALSAIEQARLEDDAGAIPGAKLIWLDQRSVRTCALRLIRLAEAERFRSKPLHDELFSSIRFEAGWKSPTEEGLAPGSLGVETPLRAAFGALRRWGLMQSLAWLGVHHLLGLRAGDAPCRLSPHLGVIVTTLGLEPGALAVGQALERVWLRATRFGMALQPLAASTLYALEGYKAIRPELRERLRQGWDELVPGSQPLIVFRLGKGSPPRVRSLRKPVSSYLR